MYWSPLVRTKVTLFLTVRRYLSRLPALNHTNSPPEANIDV
jgi:hypothetical protein